MEEQQIEFGISTIQGNKKLRLTKKQVVVMLEALWDYKTSVKNIQTEETIRKRLLEHKEEEIENLFVKLEESIDYNFEKHLEKCNKKTKEDDPGIETFGWLGENKKS